MAHAKTRTSAKYLQSICFKLPFLCREVILRVAGHDRFVKRLQGRASSLGNGGIGKAMLCLYLAYKLVFVQGSKSMTVRHLEDIEGLSMGHEDADRVAETIKDSTGMRRVV